MAYTPTNWQCGDVVTAEKLNNIESGIEEALHSGSGGESGDCISVEIPYNEFLQVYTYVASNLGSETIASKSTAIIQLSPLNIQGSAVKCITNIGVNSSYTLALKSINEGSNNAYYVTVYNYGDAAITLNAEDINITFAIFTYGANSTITYGLIEGSCAEPPK